MNRKSFAVFALVLSLCVPSIATYAADPVYPDGVPAPGRTCGDVPGGAVIDSITGKQLICTATNGKNVWTPADGSAMPQASAIGLATELPNKSEDEAFGPTAPPAVKNYQGLYHNDLNGMTRFTSVLLSFQPSDRNPTSVATCKSLSDSACNSGFLKYEAVLPLCDAADSTNCVTGLVATKADGSKVQGVVKGIFNNENPQNYVGNPAFGLPTGTEPFLVQFPGVTHSEGDLYLVKPQMLGFRSVGQSQFQTSSFRLSIYAVKLVDGKFGFTQFSTRASDYANNITEAGGDGIGTQYSDGCAAESKTQCAAMYALPLDVSFGASIKFSKAIAGWLHGRITKPTIVLQNNSNGSALLTIDAKPIQTPTNMAWISNDQMPESLKTWYGNDHSGSIYAQNGVRDLFAPFSEITLLRDGNLFHNQRTLDEYVQWLPLLGDKAQAMPTMWSVQTISQEGDPNSPVAQCINKQKNLAGLVTTNAAEYIDGPPVYADGTLDYKVAATHFEKDGVTPFQGTYDLLMSSDVARCIYGFTKAPVKASISVTNNTGGASIASTVINEANGWLTLGAYGFTFSSPTIHVKLTQDAPPSAKTSASKQTTISCVKGKTSKKVTGLKPMCPAGYKKK